MIPPNCLWYGSYSVDENYIEETEARLLANFDNCKKVTKIQRDYISEAIVRFNPENFIDDITDWLIQDIPQCSIMEKRIWPRLIGLDSSLGSNIPIIIRFIKTICNKIDLCDFWVTGTTLRLFPQNPQLIILN